MKKVVAGRVFLQPNQQPPGGRRPAERGAHGASLAKGSTEEKQQQQQGGGGPTHPLSFRPEEARRVSLKPVQFPCKVGHLLAFFV